MGLIPEGAFCDPRPFGLPAEMLEIRLDLPFPPSTNRLHKHLRSHVYRSKAYADWIKDADTACLLRRQFPRTKITGPFEIEILLNDTELGDGDNRIKAVLDWLQSREIIRNDLYCRKGRWAWVPHDEAPAGCRVILRSLHG